jgi:hypothetical protein
MLFLKKKDAKKIELVQTAEVKIHTKRAATLKAKKSKDGKKSKANRSAGYNLNLKCLQ